LISGRHGFNPFVEALPAPARAKLERLRDAQVSLSAAFAEGSTRLRHARDELAVLQSRLREVEGKHALDPMFHPRTGPGVGRYLPPGGTRFVD
jgi:hypothetical protein